MRLMKKHKKAKISDPNLIPNVDWVVQTDKNISVYVFCLVHRWDHIKI